MAVLFATFLFIGSAYAQPSGSAPATPTRGAADGALLEAYVDGAVAAHMRQHRTPGVTVSVVRDGRPLFSKGYGFADIEEAKPVPIAGSSISTRTSISTSRTSVSHRRSRSR
jgi:CubicO group peptidase (beta-lactamase class C family)